MPDLLKAIILGLVEGITEFLPVSSTGHLIVVADLLEFRGQIASTFEIFIQLGAVLAIVWFYRRDLWTQLSALPSDKKVQRLWFNILLAFLPVGIIGLALHTWIKATLFSPSVVALSLVAGGVALVFVDQKPRVAQIHSLHGIGWRQATAIGLAQVAALIPGISRSAVSIIGGLLAGLDRETATVFSFYLALPTLGLATVFDLLMSLDRLAVSDVLLLVVGLAFSFVTAFLVVGWLLRYVANHDLRLFGYYRIVAGLAILLWTWR